MAKPKVLIAGCGYVGTRLAELLLAEGREVAAARRTWGPDAPKGLEKIVADLTKPGSLRGVKGVRQVVYAASAGQFADDAYRSIYVDGVAAALEFAKSAVPAVERFVFVSSTGVYGLGAGDWVDEDSEITAPESFSSRRLLEGEALVTASGLPSVTVRLGGIYGPGRQGLLDSVRDGTARLAPGHRIWTNRIHLEDCARVLQFVLNLPEPDSLYVAVDDDPARKDEILEWIARHLGVPSPPDGEMAKLHQRGNRRCSNVRLRTAGYKFFYPTYREGFASLMGQEPLDAK